MTLTRPARSTSASLCSASCWPIGEALTPAAHTLQRDLIRRSVPSGSITSTPVLSTPTTLTLSWTSTPILASCSRAAVDSFSPNAPSTAGAASSRITRALLVSIRRKSRRSVRCASSAIWPAISTPVGPAPTTTKVSHSSVSAGSVHSSASSKEPKIRPRSSRASSMLFIPGANSENWSLPK